MATDDDLILKLYNTLSKDFIYINLNENVNIYTCGPTVYDFAHIGNFRTFIQEDFLIRILKFLGSGNVLRVMNITDVDDKTIRGANQSNKSLSEYTSYYTNVFLQDFITLNLLMPDKLVNATDCIQDIINMIQCLMDKNLAYIIDGNVYFCIKNKSDYGQLINLVEKPKNSCSAVLEDYSDNTDANDFALWKKFEPERDGNVFWESPWGIGRPGWHIECSAIINKCFSNTIDIHAGGVDLIFPHHENEIAQSEGCNSYKLSKAWFHVNHLLVNNNKMSKSLNNCYTVNDLINKGFSGREIRFALLQGHYTYQLHFSDDSLNTARVSLQRIDELIYRVKSIADNIQDNDSSNQEIIYEKNQFINFALDDLNISGCLRSVFDMVLIVNKLIDNNAFYFNDYTNVINSFELFSNILGFDWIDILKEEIPSIVNLHLHKRHIAKLNKDWATADKIRLLIEELGYSISDMNNTQVLKKKTSK